MSDVFFISGLPRSRTSWLANLLTAECAWSRQRSICLHDASKDCGGVDGLAEVFGRLNGSPACAANRTALDFVGNSDSGLIFAWPELHQRWPEARLVLVLRNHQEARRSWERYFGAHPYVNMPHLNEELADMSWGNMCRAVLQMEEGWPPGQLLAVPFEALEFETTVRRVWGFCLPGMEWNQARWELLNQLRINPASEKIALNLERVKSWVTT